MIVSYFELLGFAGFERPATGWAYTKTIVGVRAMEDVNASSIDVRLGTKFLVESNKQHTIELGKRDAMKTTEWDLDEARGDSIVLSPGAFVLAHTAETFNLPLDISAEFRLKSSAARMGLSHALAVWCDPGWHGSTLTLELHNISRYHTVVLRPGDKIGQMIFHKHDYAPDYASYAERGAYNNDAEVSGAKPPRTKDEIAADVYNRAFNTKET